MRSKLWTSLITLLILLALVLTMPLMTACGNGDEPEPTTTTPEQTTTAPEPEVSESSIVKNAVAAYLASPAGNIKPEDLKMKIAEGDVYVVSLRSADDYAAGHIPA